MPAKPVSFTRAPCVAGVLLAVLFAPIRAAIAFPFIDETNQDTAQTGAPLGTDLPEADVAGLRNQLRLVNPGAAGNPSGWTLIPRMTIQEEFNDNAGQVTSPRRGDAITILSPGISILADTSRIGMNFDYQPSLFLHAIDGPLNVLTQQLNGTGTVTVVPDLAYIDVRAASGVQSSLGLAAGTGTLGTLGTLGTTGIAGGIGTPVQGLNRNNEVQTSSFGISPYLLRQFGDYGVGKLGVSGNVSGFSTIDGFAASPFPSGGGNGQTLTSSEQIAQFTSGSILQKLQDTLLVDLLETSSRATGSGVLTGTDTTSHRQSVNNQVSYALNRTFTLLASIGEQHIQYSPSINQTISGVTWNAGVTFTPNPDSAVTVTYGHNNGADAFAANGHVALTARTLLSFDYSNTIGSQLENIQSQLNAGTLGLGGFVNAQTGGPLFVSTNALGVQSGVFRYSTLNASLVTVWDRDTFRGTFTWSKQSSVNSSSTAPTPITDTFTGQTFFIIQPGTSSGQSTDIKTGSVNWTHLLTPDLTLNSTASYTFLSASGGGGNAETVSTNVGLQYAMSPSTSLSASYSFFDRFSKLPGYSLYDNLLLLGITKKF